MSCSKVVRYPNAWLKVQRDALVKPIDESLIGLQELINWIVECGVADEITARKYVKNIKPFRCMRSFFPIFPYTETWRGLFKVMVQFTAALFIMDDVLEQDCNLNDVQEICNAYDQLDEKLRKTFPGVPSINELKKCLQYLSDKRLISIVTIMMDFVNRCARVLLRDGNLSEDDRFDYRQRLSNAVSLALQGVLSEKLRTQQDTENRLLWRRILAGAGCPLIPVLEASSGSLGKIKAHVTAITELYILFALYVVLINDVYSYDREENEGIMSESMVKMWLDRHETTNVSESIDRIIPILDTITKYVCKKVEKIKMEYPGNPELHELLDEIGYSIPGAYFMHAQASDRYNDCQMKLTPIGLKGNDLQEWLDEKDDSYGWDVLKQFLFEYNSDARKFNDVLSGVIPASGQFT